MRRVNEWLGTIGGSAGLLAAILGLATLLQNRRTVKATEGKLIAEARKLAAETGQVVSDTVGADVSTLRGLLAEVRIERERDQARIARLELIERARLRYESSLSEFIADHWREAHPGETPRPPTFEHIE